MAIGEDLTPFYRLKSDGGLAEPATITPSSGAASFEIPVIHDRFGVEGNPYSGQTMSNRTKKLTASALCKTTDADLVKEGDQLTVGSELFEVVNIAQRNDGNSKLTLELAK